MKTNRHFLWPLAATLAVMLSPTLAYAHATAGGAGGLLSGLAHPLGGLDHICAMIGVGLWAAQRGGRAIWLIPLVFVLVMCLGGLLGMAGGYLPFVEPEILASVLVLGIFIMMSVRMPLAATVGIVALFALFHGHAHGTEMPQTAAGAAYALGFVGSTTMLHACGIGLGLLAFRLNINWLARCAGATIALCGIYLCVV